MKIIHEDCDVGVATDKTLPYTAYLVEYVKEEQDDKKTTTRTAYDLVMAGKQVEIFDHYYDKYKSVEGIVWTQGVVSPRSFDNVNPQKPAKRKRKK